MDERAGQHEPRGIEHMVVERGERPVTNTDCKRVEGKG